MPSGRLPPRQPCRTPGGLLCPAAPATPQVRSTPPVCRSATPGTGGSSTLYVQEQLPSLPHRQFKSKVPMPKSYCNLRPNTPGYSPSVRSSPHRPAHPHTGVRHTRHTRDQIFIFLFRSTPDRRSGGIKHKACTLPGRPPRSHPACSAPSGPPRLLGCLRR